MAEPWNDEEVTALAGVMQILRPLVDKDPMAVARIIGYLHSRTLAAMEKQREAKQAAIRNLDAELAALKELHRAALLNAIKVGEDGKYILDEEILRSQIAQ